MRYLLDVNALLALGFLEHEFHPRVAAWITQGVQEIATCSITELGFVRVLAKAPQYGLAVSDARMLLLRLKMTKLLSFSFIADAQGISDIPSWVKTANQLTDGHLSQLAKSNSAVFATLDRKIPGAFLIPEN
jgi:predicted nucleic acid-binding protein